VIPTDAPFFCRNKLAVNTALTDIELTAFLKFLTDALKQFFKRPIARPLLETSMTGLIGWILLRQIPPSRTRWEYPENRIKDFPMRSPRSTSPTSGEFWQQRLKVFPLFFRQFHAIASYF